MRLVVQVLIVVASVFVLKTVINIIYMVSLGYNLGWFRHRLEKRAYAVASMYLETFQTHLRMFDYSTTITDKYNTLRVIAPLCYMFARDIEVDIYQRSRLFRLFTISDAVSDLYGCDANTLASILAMYSIEYMILHDKYDTPLTNPEYSVDHIVVDGMTTQTVENISKRFRQAMREGNKSGRPKCRK